ncbi:uncharacterized protein LOC133930652 [Phragmites australis]|uniref:uncharacterized protein LOC133930652 n=1 Tax=Phragmites australis TaxID=29695 RepID=UPI002D77A682|nr:uncharacterized protein LOC133930652 [Phragmites australis]
MALGAETLRRPFPAGGSDGEVSGTGALVFLATDGDRPVDPAIWGDEKRMKREIVAWAKAVASMAANKNSSSSPSPSPSMRRRG